MLCCVGLFGGLAVGQSLGGHWTITAPAIGFGVGLYGDMKLMHGRHEQNSPDGHHKSKISFFSSSSKQENGEKPSPQDGIVDQKDLRRESG